MKKTDSVDRKKTAIIVRSPFQVICALEAIQTFEITFPLFFVLGIDNSAKMALDYIALKGYEVLEVEETKNTIDAIKTHIQHEKYETIIVGDYFSYGELVLSSLWIESKGTIIYMDDGNSTLSMLPPANQRRTTNWGFSGRKVFEKILEANIRRKGVKKLFFSIYDVDGKLPFKVVRNNFLQLSSEMRDASQNGIYIIGTNSNALGWSKDEYVDRIRIIKEYVQSHYTGQNIYFCPHRMDKNDNDSIAKELGIDIFDTKVSVEVDFVSRNVFPKIVIGFGSTALLTLKKMFRESVVISIKFDERNKISESYIPIEKEYINEGILVCDLSEMNF